MIASSDKCSIQPESILEGPCSEVTTPFSAEKHLVASRPVTVQEAQGGTDKTARQVEKLKTVGAMPNVGTNTNVLPAAPQVQATPVKANERLCPCPPIWSLCFYSDFELVSGDHYDLSVSGFLLQIWLSWSLGCMNLLFLYMSIVSYVRVS
jgi:hypothetical protein